jgi:hypothetical protein
MNSGSFSTQVSLIHASSLSDHSVSNHLMHPCRRFRTLPLSPTASRFQFRLRHRYAGSPITPGRIEFVNLRTGRSPPAALHLTSRRRSCSRLQAGERMPEEDFHLSDHSRFQAHIATPVRAWIRNWSRRMSAEGAAQSNDDEIARNRVPALRASRLIQAIATTPLRAWLLHIGPSGLRCCCCQSDQLPFLKLRPQRTARLNLNRD